MIYLILAIHTLSYSLLLLIYYTWVLSCWIVNYGSICTGKMLCAQWVYRHCVVNIACRNLVSYLILLYMHDFDAILGMDSLSTHHAILECFEKRVAFHILGWSKFYFEGVRKVKPLSIFSTLQAKNMLKKWCIEFLAYMIGKSYLESYELK